MTLATPLHAIGRLDLEPLVSIAVEGDYEALAELFVRFQPSGRRVLLVAGCPQDWIEEVEQDSFIGAMRGIRRFKPSDYSKFRRWYLRILINQMRCKMRRELGRRRWMESYFNARQSAFDTYLRDKLRDGVPPQVISPIIDAVARGLSQLDPVEQELVTLRHVEGLDKNDIAAITGLRPSVIKKRAQRALRKLNKYCARVAT